MPRTDIQTLAATVEGLIEAAELLRGDAPAPAELQAIIERGKFRPLENESISYWVARYLTIRESLWLVIDEVREALDGTRGTGDRELRYFVIGYAAVCVLVGVDRVMLFDVAHHSIVQRKLNEAFPELRIPRKQFSRVFEAFVDEKGALALLDAMRFADKHRDRLSEYFTDPDVGLVARQLPELEKALGKPQEFPLFERKRPYYCGIIHPSH